MNVTRVCYWFGTLAECREPDKCTGCIAKVAYEERRRKLLAPFPIIRLATSRGNSQAPNQTLVHTHIEDGEY